MSGKSNKIWLTVLTALVIGLLSVSGLNVQEVMAAGELNTAVQCSFLIPTEFVPGSEKGLFVNVNSPMESSTIRYSSFDNGLDKALTNRERAEIEKSGGAPMEDVSTELTKDVYQSQMTAAYQKEYGEDVGFNVSSFNKIDIDGYPGFRIEASYQATDEEMVHQTVYIVLSKYRVFTITYQRAEDDDCQELFENSASSIHVR